MSQTYEDICVGVKGLGGMVPMYKNAHHTRSFQIKKNKIEEGFT